MRNVNEILGKYQQKVNFNFDERQREFISLKDFAKDLGTENTYPIEAIFINTKSKFGDNGVILPFLAVLHCMTYHVQKIFDLRLITIVGMQEIFLILLDLTYQVVYLPCLPYVIPHVYIF